MGYWSLGIFCKLHLSASSRHVIDVIPRAYVKRAKVSKVVIIVAAISRVGMVYEVG